MKNYEVRFKCTYRSCIVEAPDQKTAERKARLMLTTDIAVSPKWLEDAQLTSIEALNMSEYPDEWDDAIMAMVVRNIASMADDEDLTPNRAAWAGVADTLYYAAERIHEDPDMYKPVDLTKKKYGLTLSSTHTREKNGD